MFSFTLRNDQIKKGGARPPYSPHSLDSRPAISPIRSIQIKDLWFARIICAGTFGAKDKYAQKTPTRKGWPFFCCSFPFFSHRRRRFIIFFLYKRRIACFQGQS